MSFRRLVLTTGLVAASLASAHSHAALQGRDLDGNQSTFEAYYDTVLDLTWLADANFAMTSGFDADGLMDWNTANAWAASLNPYGSGITGWRLPTTVDVGNDGPTYTNVYQGVDYGYNITSHSEMSYMFYVNLGNKAYFTTSGSGPQIGGGLTNAGPFSNVQSGKYWSATESVPSVNAWEFRMSNGGQFNSSKDFSKYAWAVHPGDIAAVPEAQTYALMMAGLGLVAWRVRRSR